MSLAARAPSFVPLLILLGLLSMFAASFLSLVNFESNAPAGHSAAPPLADAPPEQGMSGLPDADPALSLTEQQADAMTGLMRRLQSNPTDADALTEIGEIFVMTQDWNRAEVFLTRAVLSRPGDIRPRYMLGVAQYRQERMDEAAKTFEELLAVKEDPAAMFNLAVICKYHLNRQDRAVELLRKVAASPEADADTVQKAKTELAGAGPGE